MNKEVLLKEIKKLVDLILKELKDRNLKFFQQKPTVNIYFRKKVLIGISLIDENKAEIEFEIVERPKKGEIHFFINEYHIEYELLDERFVKEKIDNIINERQEINAYNLNIRRVNKLIKDGHYAVGIVFLISAFENAVRDIFFRNNELWFFTKEGISSEELDLKYGYVIDDSKINGESYKVTIHRGDKKIGMNYNEHDKYSKWKNIIYWNYVFNICKTLRVLNEYQLSLMGNNMHEIGFFEILKEILQKSLGKYSILNFQAIDGKGGVKWCFRRFFSIDLDDLTSEIDLIKDALYKRHRIIHGFLDDSEIDKGYIVNLLYTVERVLDYLRGAIFELYQVVP